jgi:hypothetical protein
MNDIDLIDELREGMRARTEHTAVPSGFADRARRTARRRSARRAAAAGTPLLAAAGVATVLATTAGSGSSTPSGGPAPTIAEGGGHLYDTGYIIRRVRANLAAGENDVVETVETGGNGNPGSNVTATSRWYTDPQSGVEYTSSAMVSPSGTNIYDQFVVGTPINNGVRYQYTNFDPVQHLYAVSGNVGPKDPAGSAGQQNSDAQQIKYELDSGQASRDGTATVDGQPTIKLKFREPKGSTSTLYVNSRTYQPVQSVGVDVTDPQDPSLGTDTTTERWLPATAANIAMAQLAQIPAGYTQVSQATLEKDNPGAR